MKEPEFWVAVSFVVFIAILVWKGVPGMIISALDARTERIAKELAEARKLREEAQSLLAQYERRREEAEKEAEDIITLARTEAESYAVETRRKLAESLARRSRMAEDKIAQARESAIKEVRTAAADAAVEAATLIIAGQTSGKKADKLIDESIDLLKDRLN